MAARKPSSKPRPGSGQAVASSDKPELLPVVGIGASAGGLEALKAFFGAMPENPGAAFVVVVHLDPTHESLMPDLLARATSMRVAHARDRQTLEANHVYVIPPNRSLTVEGGQIRVQTVEDRRTLRGVIDRFLRSLAGDQHGRAVGIVLSGTGTEGALGVRAIEAEGGMVMVQTPDSAAQPGMPTSAIATGVADLVLAPDEMPRALLDYVRSGHLAPPAASTGAEAKAGNGLQSILALLRARKKHDFRGYKKGTLQRRVERRMGLRQIESMAEYLDFLRSQAAEADALFKDLLIGVTSFFRDPAEFEDLSATVLSALVKERDPNVPIRIWVAGCSTGEEAYSIAIALSEQLADAHSTCRPQIFATDVDEDALEVARTGTYPASIALDVSPQRLARFFTRQDHHYTIAKPIRESVVFAAQNVISDPPFSKLDLVSCRNVLIYFEPEVQERVLTTFHFALNPGGYLFLGSAEGVGRLENRFAPLSKRHRTFQRIGPVTRAPLDFKPSPRGVAKEAPPARTQAEPSVAMLADQQLLEHLAPAAVVIHRDGQIVRLYGAMDRYIKLQKGDATLDLLLLARDSLKPTLRAALHEAVRRNRPTVVDAPEVKRDKGRATLRVTVHPVGKPKTDGDLWLVVFEELASSPAARGRGVASRPPDLVRRLEAELRNTKREQRQLVEQLEGGNEELKAANEEILSMNEELQSTNEELVTSREELQSMNEELTTLNAQLQDKVQQLTVLNDDLANLLVATDIATVFLDRELRIKRFTRAASQVLNLQDSDVGRPLTQIASNLIGADLVADAHAVLHSSTPVEKEIAARDAKHYLVRGLPYRTSDERVEGVVLTLVDVTGLKHAESELQAARERVSADLRRMTRLHEVGTRLAGSGELTGLLEEILRATTEITGADAGGIFRRLEATGPLTVVAQVGFDPGSLEGFAEVGFATAPRERMVVDDVTQSSILAGSSALDALHAAGFAAVQSTPLVDRTGSSLGKLSTYYRAPHHFDADELRWLDLLARQAADIIDRRRTDEVLARAQTELEERVAERTKSLALVHEVTRAISDAPTWDEALHRVVRHLCESQGWQIGYVYLPDANVAGSFMPVVSSFGDERFRPFHSASVRRTQLREPSLAARVYAEGVPRAANGERELRALLLERGEVALQVGLEAALALPVRFGDEVIAVLELFSDQPHASRDDIGTLMSDVSAQIGRVLERERSTAQVADLVWREQQELLHTLHDALGQTLTGLGMLGSGLSQRLGRGEVAEAAETARQISEQAQQALQQVRRLARGLFPMDVEPDRFADALRELGATTESLYKLRVRVGGDDASSIRDGRVATQLYRIAQEAITNAVKHAQAHTIEIEMHSQGGRTTLRISDDGVGLPNPIPTHNGVGLRIMHHRATSIGAILSVEARPEGGTVVTCSLRDPRALKLQGG